MFASRALIRANRLLNRLLDGHHSRATYIRGFWPEPLTQTSLEKFLQDINYFEEAKKLVNIGIKQPSSQTKDTKREKIRENDLDDLLTSSGSDEKVSQVLDLLGKEVEPPELNYDHARLHGDQLVNLALNAGIYRDLFGKFVPNREHIKFTQEQAEKMDLLIPYYWITDQPFARVARQQQELDPLCYFSPVVGVTAKFIHQLEPQSENSNELSSPQSDDDLYAHTSYYGNFIPAHEASSKPSIFLDGSLLNEKYVNPLGDSQIDNWTPGNVKSVNFPDSASNKYYSLALVNLDYLHQDTAHLHWMITNIQPSDGAIKYEEVCDYLPVHGIQGFGYSRYVFLVFQHDSKYDTNASRIDDFSIESRKFDVKTFMDKNNMTPVGLSWFQTCWDASSNDVFHKYLKTKAPVYEHIQIKPELRQEKAYPGKVPFNIFLDHTRDPKEINEQVLLERLKTVDPTDYKDQYVPPRVPPTVFQEENMPSWMANVMFKKKNKLGYWRGLRPASATLPLNNNADLDYPIRPVESSAKSPPEFPNLYPAKIKYKKHKDMPTTKPANEHEHIFIQDDHDQHLDAVMKMMKEVNSDKNVSSSTSK